MSEFGFPRSGISLEEFYSKSLRESDPNKRRRLFADARQSNLCSYPLYILAAEIEEVFGADPVRLKAMLTKGVIVFRNPAGQGAHCVKVTKDAWLHEAITADRRGHSKTAAALREVVAENLQ
ncbi:hypothetical protein BGZ54_000960 [Gamsiella multidivaricata]|nr:hypothetical protein BGZ54_000960 [Gamsiella multidivaricata]